MRRTRTAGVGEAAKKSLNSARITHRIADTGTYSPTYSDGTAVITYKVGPYCYQFLQFSVKSNSAISGDTVEIAGIHYVKTSKLSKYIKRIRLELNGVTERDLSVDMYVAMQGMRHMDVAEGILYMIFGGPHQFDDKRVEDAYMLGTQDIYSMRVLFDMTSEWVDGQMHLQSLAEYAPIVRKVHFLRTIKMYRYAVTGSGLYTITNLPVHADVGAYYVLGDGILDGKIVVDGQDVITARSHELQAINLLYGDDVSKLGDGLVFDFLRSREISKGLKSLETKSERKRNADIRIELEMDGATEVIVIVDNIGTLRSQ